MKIFGVIILFNPKDEYITNILEYSKFIDKILVIDNSEHKLSYKFPHNVEYYHSDDNWGIAKSLNYAAKKAIGKKYKWMITLDQDSYIKNEAFNEILKFINNNNTRNIGIISPYHITLNSKPSQKLEEKVMEVMMSGNFLNLDVYKKVGGFDEKLFIDGVDTEYCLRLNKYKYDVIRLNNIKINHNLGNQSKKNLFKKEIICSNHDSTRRYYMFRNMLYIYDKYIDTFPKYVKFLKRVQWGQIKRIILFENSKMQKIKSIWNGYKDYKNKKMGQLEEKHVK